MRWTWLKGSVASAVYREGIASLGPLCPMHSGTLSSESSVIGAQGRCTRSHQLSGLSHAAIALVVVRGRLSDPDKFSFRSNSC